MIIGITRVRNEEAIIKNTLDHAAKFVDKIIVVDDASTDDTVKICEAHPAVAEVIRNAFWASDPKGRRRAEGDLRDWGYQAAIKYNPDWIYYFDADEYIDFDGIDLNDKNIDYWRVRLFDFYITPEDVNTPYLEREWMGCEYRDIIMLFRPHFSISFGEREPNLPSYYKGAVGGFCKHYGKAITVEEWEKTCDYYINHRGADLYTKFRDKWLARKGKAIHTKSDFNGELIKWEDRKSEKAIPLID